MYRTLAIRIMTFTKAYDDLSETDKTLPSFEAFREGWFWILRKVPVNLRNHVQRQICVALCTIYSDYQVS